MKIKNMDKAAKRILSAVKKKENIIVYGDSDLDGTASAIILSEAIRELGGTVSSVYFPDREVDGYGINKTGLRLLKNYSPALLISVDCGVTSFKEVELAKKRGFCVVIIDHHEVVGKLPKAFTVVDPKQKSEKYPFREMAAVGVVFRLIEVLFKKKMTKTLEKSFLELVALATVADMVPRLADNEEFIEKGLPLLEESSRPGLKVFFKKGVFDDYPEISQKVFKIISLLNVRDVKNRLPASFRLLMSSTLSEAEIILKELIEKNKLRREKMEQTIMDVERSIVNKDEPLIFEGSSWFELMLLSSVASILCKRHSKPVFLFKKMEKESQGTIRSPKSINSVELLKKCSKHLLTFGGHAQASGFRIKNDNIEKFKNCLIKNLK